MEATYAMKKTAGFLLLLIISACLFLNNVLAEDNDEDKDEDEPIWAEAEEYIEKLRKKGYVKDEYEAFELLINIDDHIKDSVVATSFLKEKGKAGDFYAPWKANDHDKKTAWVEGVKGDGTGEKIYIGVTSTFKEEFKPLKINFKIINGFAQNDKFYSLNNRVKKARITIYEGQFTVLIAHQERNGDLKKHISTIIELKDSSEPRKFSLNISKMLLNSDDSFKRSMFIAELEILEVYKGTKYHDTCISEFNVEVNK